MPQDGEPETTDVPPEIPTDNQPAPPNDFDDLPQVVTQPHTLPPDSPDPLATMSDTEPQDGEPKTTDVPPELTADNPAATAPINFDNDPQDAT